MIPYLTIALAVCSLFATAYMNFVRPARRRRRAAMEITPPEPRPNFAPNKPAGMTAPDGRVPRDLDRPYPRPAGGRRKPDKTCPVCGTGAETTPLDGKVLGWRAHGSCAEWLGEWRPQRPVPLPYSPDKSLIGYMEKGKKPTDPGPIEVGGRSVSVSGNLTGIASTGDGAANVIYAGGTVATVIAWGGGAGGSSSSLDSMALTNNVAATIREQLASGQVSVEEARERIITAFGVPGPVLGDAVDEDALGHLVALQEMFLDSEARACRDAIEQRRKPPGRPVITEFCTCGTKFTGTPEWIRMRLDVHRASGACPHSVKGRATGSG